MQLENDLDSLCRQIINVYSFGGVRFSLEVQLTAVSLKNSVFM